MGKKRDERPSEWVTNKRAKTPLLDWLKASEPPEDLTADWLAGRDRRERLRKWRLWEREKPQQVASVDHRGTLPDEPGQDTGDAESGSSTAAPQRFWKSKTFRTSVLLGTLTYFYGISQQTSTDHNVLIWGWLILFWWGLLRFMTWLWGHRWKLAATAATAATAVGGGVISQPHCLTGPAEEAPVCIAVSLTTLDPEPQPALSNVSRLFAVPASFGPPEWTSVLVGAPALTPTLIREIDSPDRFNHCLSQLYEVPAMNLMTRAIYRGMPRQDAHDVVMETLMAVCSVYGARDLDDLPAYFSKAVKNRSTSHFRDRSRWIDDDLERGRSCMKDLDLDLDVRSAISALRSPHRDVVKLWMSGFTFDMIGAALDMSSDKANDVFQYAKKLIRQSLADGRCQQPY